MNLGSSHYYQIMATEGYFSSGNARIKIDSTGGSPPSTTQAPSPANPPPANPPPANPPPAQGGGSVPLWGQCGGQGYGSRTCQQGTCKYFNAWYSQCQP